MSEQDQTRKLKILIVDDSDFTREGTSEMISYAINRISPGIETEMVESWDGHHAYKLIKENSFDFVLSDFKMPIWDGEDLFDKLTEENISVKKALLSGRIEVQNGFDYEDLRRKYKVFPKPANMMEIARYILQELGMNGTKN